MWTTSAWRDSTFLGAFLSKRPLISLRQSWVLSDRVCLPAVTWFERTFSSLLKRRPNICELANWRRPLNFSPSFRGSKFDFIASSISATSSSTLSAVFVTKQMPDPDCFKSSWTPRTLHTVLKSSSLCSDTFHPRSEKSVLTQKSTCLDSLLLARHKKSSK